MAFCPSAVDLRSGYHTTCHSGPYAKQEHIMVFFEHRKLIMCFFSLKSYELTYKRKLINKTNKQVSKQNITGDSEIKNKLTVTRGEVGGDKAVSYTHLTLPTTGSLCRSRWSPYH